MGYYNVLFHFIIFLDRVLSQCFPSPCAYLNTFSSYTLLWSVFSPHIKNTISHCYNPSTQETGSGGSSSSRATWATVNKAMIATTIVANTLCPNTVTAVQCSSALKNHYLHTQDLHLEHHPLLQTGLQWISPSGSHFRKISDTSSMIADSLRSTGTESSLQPNSFHISYFYILLLYFILVYQDIDVYC